MSRHHVGAGTQWQLRKLAARVKREDQTCGRCGQPIDVSLPWFHSMAWTLGHIIPISRRPDLALTRTNVRAEHRKCNRDASDRTTVVTADDEWWGEGARK